MKKFILALALMAGFSSIYPICEEDKEKCRQLSLDIAIVTDEIETHDLATFMVRFAAKKATIRSIVRRINGLMNKYPDDRVVKSFGPIRDNMEAILNHPDMN